MKETFDSTKYKNDFAKENYEHLHLALPKGTKEKLQLIGEGKSLAQTITYLIEKEIQSK